MFYSDTPSRPASRLGDQLRSVAGLLHDFLTLADDYDVDWGLEEDPDIFPYEHPHRRMLRPSPHRRRAGQAPPAPQRCLASPRERIYRPAQRDRGAAA
ncbi:MAG TPA: hypothetical protein VHX88_22040 [Solirubrobacteraceae bacterium]|jgi:hypothetical protein|nr:hypothetical protein [Solirubrobacteraceae bacterium]